MSQPKNLINNKEVQDESPRYADEMNSKIPVASDVSRTSSEAEEAYCSIENALEIIGGKWSFLILRELYEGPQRFNELRRRLHGISPKSLTDALRHLEANGVIQRNVFPTVPVTVEYSVTTKGHAFHDVLKAMKKWGREWA